MTAVPIHLFNQTLFAAGSQVWTACSVAEERRDPLSQAPLCGALKRHGIAHVGVCDAAPRFAVTRVPLKAMHAIFCTSGQGEVLIDGDWRTLVAGEACLAPPFAPHAYRSNAAHRWEHVWVRFMAPRGKRPSVFARAPLVARFDGNGLKSAVLGLCHELQGTAQPALLEQWSALIDCYAQRFVQPWLEDDRLHGLWEEVSAGLARDWSVRDLARRACLSEEQLRRLSNRTLGRSPHQQLTFLRMHNAAEQLLGGSGKLEIIAQQVGFQSVFSFSNAFQRFFGCRPSEYRAQKRARVV